MKNFFLIVFFFTPLQADLWDDFQSIYFSHQAYNPEYVAYDDSLDEQDIFRMRGNKLYYVWEKNRFSKEGKSKFSQRYVKIHNKQLWNLYLHKDEAPMKLDDQIAYETVCESGASLFNKMEKFTQAPRPHENKLAWFTALLEAADVSLIEMKQSEKDVVTTISAFE